MIPHQQHVSPSSPAQREIDVDPTKAVAVVPVVQVGNSQEMLATYERRPKAQVLLLKSMENAQCESEMMPRILQMLLGQDTFIYDQDALDKVKYGESAEKLHHRNLITYALQAENALTTLKIHLAELRTLKNLKGVSDKRRDKKTCARLAVASFCKIGICYLALFDKLNSDKKALPLEGEGKSQYFYGKHRIKRAKKTLEATEERYKKILHEKKLTHQDIKTELFDFANQPKFLVGLADCFKATEFSALRIKVNHFVDLLQQGVSIADTFNLEGGKKLATSERLPQVQIAEIPSELEFTEERQPASESFWQAFTKVKNKDEHKEKFFEFMLTDWSVHYFYDIHLTNELVKARSKDNPDFKKECLILLEKCLQKNLLSHAAEIIMHALRVKDKQSELEQAIKNKLTEKEILVIQYDQMNSLYQLKKIISQDYNENVLKYNEMKARVESSEGLSVQEKNEFFVIKKNLGQSAVKKRKNSDLTPSFTFPYLNQILHLMRENLNFADNDAINLAAFYLKQEREKSIDTASQFVRVPVKRSHIPRQKFDEPPAKINMFEQQQALSRLPQTVSLPEQAESPFFTSCSQYTALQRTEEEIDMEEEGIPILDEAAPVERALLKQLREIQSMMEMTPSLRFLLPSTSQEASISDAHSSPLNFGTTAQFDYVVEQQKTNAE